MSFLVYTYQIFLLFLALVLTLSGCQTGKGDLNILHEDDAYRVITLTRDGIITKSPSGSRPIYRYKGEKDTTYFGYYNSTNQIIIRAYSNDTHNISPERILWRNWGFASNGKQLGDDHANPSIIVLKHQRGKYRRYNGRLLVGAAEHGGRLQVRRSVASEDVREWAPAVSIESDGATYARLVELYDGKVLLFSRLSAISSSNSKATYYYWESHDGGDTWTERQKLVDVPSGYSDSIYLSVESDPTNRTVHFGLNRLDYNNPRKGQRRYRDIFYLWYDATVDRWHENPASNNSIGPPPFNLYDLEPVYKSGSIKPVEWTYITGVLPDRRNPKLLSISDKDRGSKGALQGNRPVYLLEHYWAHGHWKTRKIGKSSRGRSVNFHYVTMADYVDSLGNEILAFQEDGNFVKPVIFERVGDTSLWSAEGLIMADSFMNSEVHARPYSTREDFSGLQAIWASIRHYENSPYTEWESSIVGYVKK